MPISELTKTARTLVADGRGILAADETVPTITKRLTACEVASTFESRRAYREMLFRTPDVEAFIAGVILQDETIRQPSQSGEPLVDVLARRGIIPGIKVDAGATPMAGAPGERVTEGLDGLRARLEDYRRMGARFAKWRAVIRIAKGLPTPRCVQANAWALARYASLCQEAGLVPIVEPEVLMDGTHTIARCEEVTGEALHAVFAALYESKVSLEEMLLKPNMVVSGKDCPTQASIDEVADATLRTLRRHVPPAVVGIVFLSGGQDPVTATKHLDAVGRQGGPKPWKLSFSFGRALQDEAMSIWHGRGENVDAGQHAFYHRAQCDSAAALGRYASTLENAA